MSKNIYYKKRGQIFYTSNENEDEDTKFFVNSLNLLDTLDNQENENKDALKEKFLYEIANSVRDFIGLNDNKFDNIIVLMGAGASILNNDRTNEGGVSVDSLFDSIKNKLNDNYESNKVYNYDDLINLMSIDKNKIDGLEHFISLLDDYEKFCPQEEISKFHNSKLEIFKEIIDKTRYKYSEKFNHESLINLINNNLVKNNNKLNIITTNYDTLIEEAANNLNYTIFDGFSFSNNPTFDDDLFNWNLFKNTYSINSNETIIKKNVINLLKIHGSLSWQQSKDNVIRINKPKTESLTLDNLPLMIFPSSNKYKQSYQNPYFSLFSKFQELMKIPNTLLITVGFSFGDTHITEMINNAIKNNPGFSLLITKHSIKENDNLNEIMELMKKGYDVSILRSDLNDNLCYFLGGENNAN